MAEANVPAVVPRQWTGSDHAGPVSAQLLPVPDLAAVHSGPSTVYRIAAVDERGRIAERAVVQALEWGPGQRVRFDLLSATALVLRPEPTGLFGLTRRGHIPLPVPVRRWCRVQAGDRVLLAASAQRGLLAIYTMAALESMINEFPLPNDGGERS
ncbi:hypothetical protein BJ969_003067 [Saccharopolyspora gloriosae]|uniref:Uncharacterized protein n=1 Tax=Saccharopolyspora gloriosae TaxID=455344 RepID=A0A840NL15_9PSEU|nr:AbrB/MazE/SpoVT family DNA-binding domain-containing protein [Saccharopolyspora gloriosae]MBB5069979.1 hypothetical protein [Saccharopolyspora gloriosae]